MQAVFKLENATEHHCPVHPTHTNSCVSSTPPYFCPVVMQIPVPVLSAVEAKSLGERRLGWATKKDRWQETVVTGCV